VMARFVFLIQNCIDVVVEGESVEEARRNLLYDLDRYEEQMMLDPYVSDGEECDE
jgi:hypothetical protein